MKERKLRISMSYSQKIARFVFKSVKVKYSAAILKAQFNAILFIEISVFCPFKIKRDSRSFQ